MSATYGLRFGDLDFSPQAQVGEVEYRIYGLKRGYPVAATVVADSMMQDGAVEQVTNYSNRDQQIVIGLKSSDSQALAAAESALWLEAQKSRNELAWTPPDGYGATTVFDVLWCDLSGVDDADDWDIKELRDCERVYTLTVRALPFGRSEVEIVSEALTSGATATSTTISSGASATNWTGTATVSASGGWLQQTVTTFDRNTNPDGAYYTSTADWIYSAAVDFSTEPYLSVDVDPPGIPGSNAFFMANPKLYADGVEQVLVAIDQPPGGVYRLTFAVSDTSVTVLKLSTTLRTYTTLGTAPSTALHRLDNVVKSNQAPGISSTGRESVRRVEVKGSARTAASLSVEHETTGLGNALIYTAPSLSDAALGYQPPLRRWKTVGNAGSTDATSISGTTSVLAGAILGGTTFNVPSSALPRGTFVLMGRLRMSTNADATGKVSWTAGSRVGSTLFGAKTYTSPSLSLLKSSGAFKIVPLGMMTLPLVDMPAGSSGTVELGPFTWSGANDVVFDELWLFWLGDDAALSWVQAGSFQRIWLDPASASNPVPSVWVGNSSDRSDAIHGGTLSVPWAQHSFRPPAMNVFVATEGAANPAVRLRHFPRWHSHAEQVS